MSAINYWARLKRCGGGKETGGGEGGGGDGIVSNL